MSALVRTPTWSCSRRAHGPAPDRLGGTVDGSIPVLSIDEAVGRSTFSGPVLFVDLRGDLEIGALRRARRLGGRASSRSSTPYLSVGPNLGFTHVNDVLGRLYTARLLARGEHGVRRHRRPARRSRGTSTRARCGHARSTAIVAGVHGRSDTSLAAAVERAGVRLLVAGDAVAPRTALHAFREGDDVGRAA